MDLAYFERNPLFLFILNLVHRHQREQGTLLERLQILKATASEIPQYE